MSRQTDRQTAAVGAGGRGCNPWGQGPAFERPVLFQGLGVALGSHRDPVGSGSSPGLRFGAGEVRPSRAPGARHSPLPPCSRAWWGGTRAPADAGCSVRSARRPLQPSASAARRLPPPHLHAPETLGPRRTYGAPLRRPRASRGLHGASGPASPAAAPPRKWTPAAGPGRPGPPLVQGRPDGRSTSGANAQASGALQAAGLRHLQRHRRRARLAQGCAATEQALGPEPNSVLTQHPILRTGCHLCFPMAVRGRLDYFPPWYKNCLNAMK